jgi:hypothetical protein
MESIDPSYLFPVINICAKAQALINKYKERHDKGIKGQQLKLLKHLDIYSNAEKVFPDYKITADDYQTVSNDLIVLQAWIAYLPVDMRDVHVKRFFNEMCFTNKLNMIKQLEVLGLRTDRLAAEFIARLEKRARAKNYQELAGYLLAFSRSSRSISNPTKCSEVKP